MKKLTLLAAAAISCCAFSPTFAQVQILRSATRPTAPRLVSDKTELNDLEPFATAGQNSLKSVAQEAIPNPFDYFSEELPTVEPKSDSSNTSPELLTEEQSLLEGDLPTSFSTPRPIDAKQNLIVEDSDEAGSSPVGLHHHRNPSVVDTIVNQATLGNIPHCATSPINWGTTQHTPNAVAEWLLREQCVEGLWANYPQQRAAECAQMWANLAGHSACGSGSGCNNISGPCSACAQPSCAPALGRHNRYTGRFSAPPMGCEPCNTCQTGTAPCASCSGIDSYGPAAPGCASCAQTSASMAPSQLVKTGMDNVAQLPSLQTYR